MTLIVRQSFANNLFGFGAAVSMLLMIAMLVWVAVWYRAFKRDLEAGMSARPPRARWSTAASTRSPSSCCS